MRALLPSIVLLASVLAACGTPDSSLPTLAPTLDNAGGFSAGQQASPEATAEATTEASISASPTPQASRTPAASPTPLLPSATPTPQASASPTRRPTLAPTPFATMTRVPTATPLSLEASPTPEPAPEQADATPTPRTRPTVPPYDPASAFSAYRQVAPLAQDEHPTKQLFFISGEAQAGWTIGFIDRSNPEAQAIYQVAPNASVQTLDLLVPLSGGLRPFSIDQVRLDSPALAQRLSAAGFNPSSSTALIYTLQADARGLVWEVQDTSSGQRLALDARSGMIVP